MHRWFDAKTQRRKESRFIPSDSVPFAVVREKGTQLPSDDALVQAEASAGAGETVGENDMA